MGTISDLDGTDTQFIIFFLIYTLLNQVLKSYF